MFASDATALAAVVPAAVVPAAIVVPRSKSEAARRRSVDRDGGSRGPYEQKAPPGNKGIGNAWLQLVLMPAAAQFHPLSASASLYLDRRRPFCNDFFSRPSSGAGKPARSLSLPAEGSGIRLDRKIISQGGQTMKLVRFLVGVAMAASPAMAASAQPVSLTIASSLPAQHTSTKAMEIFKEEVARRTHNAIQIELVPDEKMGSASELVQKGRTGSIFGFWLGAVYMSRLVPETELINLPFVFNNYGQVMRALDGAAGKLIEAKLDAKGYTTLAWMELGARNVANARRPLKTIDDFKDLRLFTQPAETFLATFRALGADPRVIPTKEVHNALQQGDLDGMEATYSIIAGHKFYEQLKYISDTNHILDLVIFAVNKQVFMNLPPDQQKVLKEAAKSAAIQQRKMAEEGEAASFALLKTKLQFDPISPEMRAAMRRATARVIKHMRLRIGADLVDKVVADAGKR